MNLSEERLAEFNARMNQWIAKQGLLFQLTNEGTGLGGQRPSIVNSLIRFLASLLSLAVLGGLAYAGFLIWQVSGDKLPEKFEIGISEMLSSEKTTAIEFKRDLNTGNYKQIQVIGGTESFFNHLDASEVSFKMEPTTGLFGSWNANIISIERLRIALKAGDVDTERAEKAWQSLFNKRPNFSFNSIEVSDANLSWGYSLPATWGSILHSNLKISHQDEGYKIQFVNGQFSHGIFRDLTIEKLEVDISPDNQLTISEATLKSGQGTLTFNGKMVSGGSQPIFEFEGQFSNLPIASFLPPAFNKHLGGSFSGEFTANGSTNDSNGICFHIKGNVENSVGIMVSKEFAALELLSHLDPRRSYRKLLFNQGSFELEKQSEVMSFSNVNLSSFDEELSLTTSRLQGDFKARPMTPQDLQGDDKETEQKSSQLSELEKENATGEFEAYILKEFDDFQLKNPHQELRHITHDANNNKLKKERVDLVKRRHFRPPYLLEGQLILSVVSSTFDDYPPLPAVANQADQDGLSPITIDLSDTVPDISRRLRVAWQNAMNEADPERFKTF